MPEGGQQPPAEYRSPYQRVDGSLVRRDDPDRPPTTFTRWKDAVSDAIDRFNARVDRVLGGKKPTGRPAGEFVRASDKRQTTEVVDLHGPIVDPAKLSHTQSRLRDETRRRHPSHTELSAVSPSVDDPQTREQALSDEIDGVTRPGTEEPFVDVPEAPYKWDSDPEIAVTHTPVTELASAATWQEVVDAKRLGAQKGSEAPGLRLVVDNDPKKPDNHTPPDDNGGGNAA